MSATRRSVVAIVGLAVACSEAACSEAATPARTPPEAGPDATACPNPCTGTCERGRCLVKLASVAGPGHLAVDGANAYFTICSPDGVGAALSVGLAGGAPPLVLATGSHCPGGAALDANAFYVAGLGANDLTRIPLGGGPASVLGSTTSAPAGVAVDDVNAYVATESGSLFAVPLGGGTPSELASGEASMTAPAADGTDVYFGAPASGKVKKVPRRGGAVTTLATIDTIAALALSPADVYLAAGYVVSKLSKAGGLPETLGTAAGADITAIATDDASVYFASYADLWKIPLGGGPAVLVVGGQTDVTSIAVDGTSVYFTNRIHSPADPTACCGSVLKLTPK